MTGGSQGVAPARAERWSALQPADAGRAGASPLSLAGASVSGLQQRQVSRPERRSDPKSVPHWSLPGPHQSLWGILLSRRGDNAVLKHLIYHFKSASFDFAQGTLAIPLGEKRTAQHQR